MRLSLQKRLAGQILRISKKRIRIDPSRLADVKEVITGADIRKLIKEGAIIAKPVKSVSRGRARKIKEQKRKGRRRGHGSRKGKASARLRDKTDWMNKIRIQRDFLKELRDKGIITRKTFGLLYLKSKGGFFRSKRHIKLYVEERGLAAKKAKK